MPDTKQHLLLSQQKEPLLLPEHAASLIKAAQVTSPAPATVAPSNEARPLVVLSPDTAPPTTLKGKPDFALFLTVVALLLALAFFVLQSNGVEVNWFWSAVIYLGAIAGIVWTYLVHLVPHLGRATKITSSTICVLLFGWIFSLGIRLQYQKQHPPPPVISVRINTLEGLPDGITNNPHYKFSILKLQNENDFEIDNLCGRLQLPEPIFQTIETDASPGLTIAWQPLHTKTLVTGTGNKTSFGPNSMIRYIYSDFPYHLATPPGNAAQLTGFSDSGDETGVWMLMIDRLPPHGALSISFLTTDEDSTEGYIKLINTPFTNDAAHIEIATSGQTNGGAVLHYLLLAMIVHTNKVVNTNEDWHLGTNELRFLFQGEYQYANRGNIMSQGFLTPFSYDTNNRTISSFPTQAGDGRWKRVVISYN
jgi:hypothetical protein